MLDGALMVVKVCADGIVDLGGLGCLPAVPLQELPVVHEHRVHRDDRPGLQWPPLALRHRARRDRVGGR